MCGRRELKNGLPGFLPNTGMWQSWKLIVSAAMRVSTTQRPLSTMTAQKQPMKQIIGRISPLPEQTRLGDWRPAGSQTPNAYAKRRKVAGLRLLETTEGGLTCQTFRRTNGIRSTRRRFLSDLVCHRKIIEPQRIGS